jgi:hypothetical protein
MGILGTAGSTGGFPATSTLTNHQEA